MRGVDIAAGYVGLVKEASLTEVGDNVCRLDHDAEKVASSMKAPSSSRRWHRSRRRPSRDLKYQIVPARNVSRHMTDYRLVADKSSAPVGFGQRSVHSCLSTRPATEGVWH